MNTETMIQAITLYQRMIDKKMSINPYKAAMLYAELRSFAAHAVIGLLLGITFGLTI